MKLQEPHAQAQEQTLSRAHRLHQQQQYSVNVSVALVQRLSVALAPARMLRRLWAREEGRYRGGWKQRLAQGEGAGEDNEPSHLCSGLLLEWADGLMSACRLQAHVERAEHDGLRHPMVQRLAALPKGRRAQQGLRN